MSGRGLSVFFGCLLLSAFGIGIAINQGRLAVPDRWNPWAPLDVRDPAEHFLRWKLARLYTEPEECRNVLQQTQLRYDMVDDQETGAGCGFTNAVLISDFHCRGRCRVEVSKLLRQ